MVQCRVTEEQRVQIARKAKAARQSISDYLRASVLDRDEEPWARTQAKALRGEFDWVTLADKADELKARHPAMSTRRVIRDATAELGWLRPS
jgi:hypothetical protein